MNDPRLYAILDLGYTPESRAEEVTTALLAGGADLLQLRAKGHDLVTIRRVAEKLIPLCRAAGIPFILNDHPALAAEIGADGVHIGQDDGTLSDARAAIETDRGIHSGLHSFIHSSSSIQDSSSSPFLFGRSTHSLAQARAALAEGFDYIGFGPLFPTPTKAGRPAIGIAEVAAMQREVGEKIPAFCIGGIKRSNLAAVLETGARRVVIVSDLLSAENVQAATAEVKSTLSSTSSVHFPT
ncbi:MAG: thiamine phosphate synthase [Verrucomicrobiota bacterium]